ncbi:hypothetical protein DPMN_090025 [Dreissena polymorpha]|uniref:Uncharacterized protein n=1 Tax=Dreissena polymorpha TaxID=45954 RepID=A0A9D4QXZ0_DREPO|nr:hypothetical protein DPMN_090025 [Dreissena polymorpha]
MLVCCKISVNVWDVCCREKKKEKDREDLWKKLETLEVKSGNKNKLLNNVS